MIELKSVSKSFTNNSWVLKNINIKIEKGNFTVLVGPSGSGKSSILRLIAGLDFDYNGDILIENKNVNNLPAKDRNVAMVFQNYALYPHLTIKENLAFPLKIKGLDKKSIAKKIAEVAEILEITDQLEKKPKQLSGGQKQRVAIGRALVRDPKIFLFDEPLSNLDIRLRDSLRQKIAQIHRLQKSTTIYVTHDQHEALSLAEQLIVLNKGEIQQKGAAIDLFNKPANLFVAEFVGYPKTNKILGSVDDASYFIYQDIKICKAPKGLKAKDIYLSIRPNLLKIFITNSKKNLVKMQLIASEFWGNNVLYIFKLGQQEIQVESGVMDLKLNKNYYIEFNQNSIMWFDKGGKAIV